MRSGAADSCFTLNKYVLGGRRDDGSVFGATCLLSEHQSWDFSNCTEWFTTSARPSPWGFMPSSGVFRCTPKSGIHRQSHMYIKMFSIAFKIDLKILIIPPLVLTFNFKTPPLWNLGLLCACGSDLESPYCLVGNRFLGSADVLD